MDFPGLFVPIPVTELASPRTESINIQRTDIFIHAVITNTQRQTTWNALNICAGPQSDLIGKYLDSSLLAQSRAVVILII
jgi:hypothetical protein